MEHYGYIYLTENLINGHKYIGQHKTSSFDTKYYGSGKLILQAMKLYGKENFKVHILEWCKNKWELDSRERAWIRFYDAVHSPEFYNITQGGNRLGSLPGELNGMWGRIHSKESRKRMSIAQNNRYNRCSDSKETRLRKSLSHQGEKNYINTLTSEQVLEILEIRKTGLHYKEIAKMFNVSKSAISHILNGESWSWLTGIKKPYKGIS